MSYMVKAISGLKLESIGKQWRRTRKFYQTSKGTEMSYLYYKQNKYVVLLIYLLCIYNIMFIKVVFQTASTIALILPAATNNQTQWLLYNSRGYTCSEHRQRL